MLLLYGVLGNGIVEYFDTSSCLSSPAISVHCLFCPSYISLPCDSAQQYRFDLAIYILLIRLVLSEPMKSTNILHLSHFFMLL